jgi:VWFA-related protein
MRSKRRRLVALLTLALGASAPAAQQPQTPSFQARADIIPVDVSVLDGRGQPVLDLAAADFTVRIDGQPRRVISAEWIPLTARGATAPEIPVPEGYSSNEQSTGGRLILLAIDQPNIPFTAVRPMQDTVSRFVDGLEATDRIAVIGFGAAAPSISFTTDHNRVKQAIARMPGQQSARDGRHSVGLSTALTFERFEVQNDADRCAPRCTNQALEAIVSRDCPAYNPSRPDERTLCKAEILSDARDLIQTARQEGDVTIRAMQSLLTALKGIDAPKTMIVLSQRFFMDTDRDGVARVTELGALAAAARTSIYGIRLEEESFNIAQRSQSVAPVEDRRLQQQGLETLTSAARGTLFNVTGTGTGIFDRITSELSGYYLLGVEPAGPDRDGKPHAIGVDVSRRGLTVRSRRTMLATAGAADALATSPRDAAMAALAEPFLLTRLPMRGIVFALRGADPSQLQLLIHVEIGSTYTGPVRLAVAHAVFDRDGRAIDGQVTDSRLGPAANGVPSPIEFVAGASVGPGDYTVKLAAVDGDRIGSLELPVRATLIEAGAVKLTELMAGGPVPPGDLLRPSIGARVAFGSVHGYLEAYGSGVSSLAVSFEIAPKNGGAALLTANVPARSAGDDRALFSHMMQVQSLPAGEYQLRAIVSRNETPLKTLTRAFDVPPSNAAAPAAAAGTSIDLAIAVDAKDLTPIFKRDDALRPATVAPFRAQVTTAAGPAFEQGLAQMQKAEYADAEKSFRRAQQQDPESASPLVYLAACLAAAGYDSQAAAAWQTALARGSNVPEVYEWLGESLMRDRLFGDARTVLEDAVDRFPADTRFARSLALLLASSGKGRDAVKTMERFLEKNPGDARATFLVVQWLFNLHRGGAIVHGRVEDLQLARDSAARYAKTTAPDQPLVKQWLDFLEKEKP